MKANLPLSESRAEIKAFGTIFLQKSRRPQGAKPCGTIRRWRLPNLALCLVHRSQFSTQGRGLHEANRCVFMHRASTIHSVREDAVVSNAKFSFCRLAPLPISEGEEAAIGAFGHRNSLQNKDFRIVSLWVHQLHIPRKNIDVMDTLTLAAKGRGPLHFPY